MSNPTTPFNWQMPTNTDLVTDLPADFEVFGQAVASSMADLLGGTSGQILSKATNADMDFTWINNDQGDITGITATSPLTGGGTSGAITVGIQSASTSQSGAVQLSDSTSTTSSVLAGTSTAVKAAKDAADAAQTTATAAIPKSTVTTAGDVIYATGSSAVTRLGIGTSGQVLRVNSGATAPEWATPAASASGLTLVKSQTIGSAVSAVTVTDAFSATYDNYLIIVSGGSGTVAGGNADLTLGSTTSGYYMAGYYMFYSSTTLTGFVYNPGAKWTATYYSSSAHSGHINLQNPYLAKTTTFQSKCITADTGAYIADYTGFLNNTTSYTAFTLTAATGTMTGGTIRVYGYQNS
jgi:hypothetical protein